MAAKSLNPRQWKEIPATIAGILRGAKIGLGEGWNVLRGAEEIGSKYDVNRVRVFKNPKVNENDYKGILKNNDKNPHKNHRFLNIQI